MIRKRSKDRSRIGFVPNRQRESERILAFSDDGMAFGATPSSECEGWTAGHRPSSAALITQQQFLDVQKPATGCKSDIFPETRGDCSPFVGRAFHSSEPPMLRLATITTAPWLLSGQRVCYVTCRGWRSRYAGALFVCQNGHKDRIRIPGSRGLGRSAACRAGRRQRLAVALRSGPIDTAVTSARFSTTSFGAIEVWPTSSCGATSASATSRPPWVSRGPILMPMLIVMAGATVRYAMAYIGGRHLGVPDLAGIAIKAVPWSFFVGSMGFATGSLVGQANLVTKIYFPREVLPLASTLAQAFDASIGILTLLSRLLCSTSITASRPCGPPRSRCSRSC